MPTRNATSAPQARCASSCAVSGGSTAAHPHPRIRGILRLDDANSEHQNKVTRKLHKRNSIAELDVVNWTESFSACDAVESIAASFKLGPRTLPTPPPPVTPLAGDT